MNIYRYTHYIPFQKTQSRETYKYDPAWIVDVPAMISKGKENITKTVMAEKAHLYIYISYGGQNAHLYNTHACVTVIFLTPIPQDKVHIK
jgi:hypothetical protein